MELETTQPCRKTSGKNCSFEFKTFVIDQINNGQISLNFAAKKYNISRSTLDYWRKKHPRAGTRKLCVYLREELNNAGIKIGRDTLFALLRQHNLLLPKTKRFHITTNSNHYFYKSHNLMKNRELTHAEQAVVSDISYLKTDTRHTYLAIVTDPFSKKIMGYAVDDNMRVDLVKKTLKMARNNMIFNHKTIIHHSDRGIQYCCPDYSAFAENMGFKLSTTQQYDPYENAVAERINETMKYEYGLNKTARNLLILRKIVV
ncbi:MAG: IS3 family transposase [Bacteroidales bacterium]|jgi:transposase InsO family protein|nr:IS3 family transposase [Bacteroidales bacterium]